MNTKVINLFGGPGVGKSTIAALVFYHFKTQQKDIELVREYIKKWAWAGIKPSEYDQTYIFGKQAKAESDLYHKVEYIVTDSPLLLSPIYERYYKIPEIVGSAASRFMDVCKGNGIEYYNFLLKRHKPYSTKGRYQNEEGARKVDIYIEEYLKEIGESYTVLGHEDKVNIKIIEKTITR